MINDHHGTGSATVSNDKNLTVTRRRTLPFGDVRGTKPTAWAGDRGFVGGTMDNTGLTHLGAREYDPAIGKFISVDPVMDLNDPEQWNAYTYSNSSPVTMSDPSGLYGSWCATLACAQATADVNGCPGCTYDTPGKPSKPRKAKKSGRFSIGSPNPPRALTAAQEDFKFDPLATPTYKDRVSLATWQARRFGCLASVRAGVGPCAALGEAPYLYDHYMSADGGDKEIDFSHADEDPSIAGDVSTEISQAQRAIEKLAIGEGETFSITGDGRNIANNPETEKWQKTLGSYNMWSSADVRVEGKTISMRMTIRAYDRWDFNKEAEDIKTGLPDRENGRFAELGWAKGFNTSGTMVRDVVWTAGSSSSTTVTEPWRPRW
jgi:RHS repeat-associated protein